MSSPQNAHTIIDELINLNHNYFCIAPGSRNTPLVYATHKNPKADSFVFFDERSLAFHALGYAKAQKKAAVIIVTSGSALANLYPAIVEAHSEKIPMIVLSADRPFFLQNCGFNQTLDQTKFFGSFVQFEANLPLMESLHLSFLKSTLSLASHKSLKGPIQLNCQFSEAFINWSNNHTQNDLQALLKCHDSIPYLKTTPILKASKNGVILVAKDVSENDCKAIEKLSTRLNYPIFADPLANMQRLPSANNICFYDLILENQKIKFDTALQFGGSFNSTKSILINLKNNPPPIYWHISKEIENQDPNFLKAEFFHSDIELFCERLQLEIESDSSQLKELQLLDKAIEEKLCFYFNQLKELSEPDFVHQLLLSSSNTTHTFIASSSPIRWALKYGLYNSNNFIYSNRGLSGIDGNLATAFGLSQGLDKPIQIIIGDLAFLYDLNSLAQIKKLRNPVDIFVLNNHGGGIFTCFDIHQDKELFERYFQDKHDLNFENIAKQFDLEYHSIKSKEDCSQVNFEGQSHSRLIEVKTTNEINMRVDLGAKDAIKTLKDSNLVY